MASRFSRKIPEREGIAWTPRQREVLNLLADGFTNPQIGERLGLTLDGAKWHVSEVLSKLGVNSREDAAIYWREHNRVWNRLQRGLVWMAPGGWLRWAGLGGAGAGGLAIIAVATAVLLSAGDAEPQAFPMPEPTPTGSPTNTSSVTSPAVTSTTTLTQPTETARATEISPSPVAEAPLDPTSSGLLERDEALTFMDVPTADVSGWIPHEGSLGTLILRAKPTWEVTVVHQPGTEGESFKVLDVTDPAIEFIPEPGDVWADISTLSNPPREYSIEETALAQTVYSEVVAGQDVEVLVTQFEDVSGFGTGVGALTLFASAELSSGLYLSAVIQVALPASLTTIAEAMAILQELQVP